ncbi:MAG: extracellular solute-binding protein, partial [Hungatella sp.]
MKRKQVILTAAASIILGSLLCACGSSNEKSTSEVTTVAVKTETTAPKETSSKLPENNYYGTYDVAGAGDVALDVMITSLGDSDGGPYLRGVMDSYMKMYPNVKLNPVECSMNDLYTTLITQTTAGTLPDIFTMTEAYSANCLEMEMSVNNMAELLGEEYLNGLMEAAVQNATVDKTLVYMPWQNNITAMVYRKDLFEEKGIEIPKTWDEFLEVAK